MPRAGCLSCGRAGASFIPPGGDGGFRRSSPLRGSPPFSGANAVSTLRPRPGLHHSWRSWNKPRKRIPLVRKKAGFTHDMTFFQHDVRGKRFSTHGRVILGSQQRFVRRWNNRTQIGAKYGFSHVVWSKYFIFRGNKSSFVDVFTI